MVADKAGVLRLGSLEDRQLFLRSNVCTVMKLYLPFFCILALSLAPAWVTGQENNGPTALVQQMFSPDISEAALAEAIKAAGQAGVPRQQIIEAKLIWGVRHQDAAYLAKMLPELEVLATSFDPDQTAGLRSADEVRAFIAYAKALQAKEADDQAPFKQQILEAVWLNPQQTQIFTQAIEQVRREAAMATMKVDLTLPLTTSAGEATTLGDVVGNKKGLLLDFWASWCGPCMQLMPELKKKAEFLQQHGVVVAGVNKDDEKAQEHAARVHDEQEIKFPWLIEPGERPFTKLLQIESIPRMVLVTPEGKVLFNGHPQDPNLWKALQKLDPEIKPPSA